MNDISYQEAILESLIGSECPLCPECGQLLNFVDDGHSGIECSACQLTFRLDVSSSKDASARSSKRSTHYVSDAQLIASFTPRIDVDYEIPVVPSEKRSLQLERLRRFNCLAAGVLLVLTILIGVNRIGRPEMRSEIPVAARLIDQLEHAGNWEAWGELVRHRDAVLPLMKAYYAEGFEPFSITAPLESSLLNWAEHEPRITSRIQTNQGVRELALVRTSTGPQFEWETFVRYEETQWSQFHEQQPSNPVELRVYLCLSDPPLSSERERAELDKTVYVRMYLWNSHHYHIVALPENLLVNGQPLESLLRWDSGLKVRLRGFWSSDSHVKVDSLLQLGWVRERSEVDYEFPVETRLDLDAEERALGSAVGAVDLSELTSLGEADLFQAMVGRIESSGNDSLGLNEEEFSEGEAQAKACLVGFGKAKTWKQKQKYVLEPERVRSALRAYYQDDPQRDAALPLDSFNAPIGFLSPEDEQRGISVLVKEGSGDEWGPMVLFFKNGLLDWESYIQLKDELFKEFVRTRYRNRESCVSC